MTRREMMALLGAGAAQPTLAQSPLKFSGLDHIEFTVKDVVKSTDFYAELFGGANVMKNRTTTRRYIKLGTSYMAIDVADIPRIDHACIGIENFDINAVHAFLTAQGLIYRDYPSGRDTGVNDPDGTRLQLAAADGWTSLAAQTASPEPRYRTSLLRPIALSAVQINVSDLGKGASHYAKILGPSAGRSYAVGDATVDLFSGPPGYRGFTIRLSELTGVQRTKLAELGVSLEPIRGGFKFLDPDGFAVEFALPVPRVIQ